MVTVLVVDDDPTMLEMVKGHLTALGYYVLTAPDAVQGAMSAMTRRPDIILTDFLMPSRSGKSIFDQLAARPETASIPIVVMSSFPAVNIKDYLPTAIRHNIVSKPLDFAALNTMFQSLVGKKPDQV